IGFLRVSASLASDNAIDLRLTPEVQYGEPTRRFVPDDEPRGRLAGWAIDVRREVHPFDDLTFSLRLDRGQVAILTCLPTPRDSLGARFFTHAEKPTALQRVVLIQAEPAGAAR